MCALTIVLQSFVAKSKTLRVPIDVPQATWDASSESAIFVTTPSLAAYSVYSEKSIGQILNIWSSLPVIQNPALMAIEVIAEFSCSL